MYQPGQLVLSVYYLLLHTYYVPTMYQPGQIVEAGLDKSVHNLK